MADFHLGASDLPPQYAVPATWGAAPVAAKPGSERPAGPVTGGVGSSVAQDFVGQSVDVGSGVISVGARDALNSTATPSSKRQLPVAGLDSLIPIPYGAPMYGPMVANILSYNNTWVFWLIWGHGPLEAIDEITMNDAPFWPSDLPVGASVTNYTGTDPQSSDGTLGFVFGQNGSLPGFNLQLPGIAHSVIVLPAAYAQGMPKFVVRVRGRRVFDPRDVAQDLGDPTTWVYSANPALILADFLSSTLYGAGRSVDWTSVGVVAGANDSIVGTGPGAEKLRTANLVVDKEATIAQWVETLRTAASCYIVPQGETVKLIPDATGTPAVTYDHDAGNIIAVHDDEIKDLSDLPTVIELWYTDTSSLPWKDAYARAERPGVSAGTTPLRKSTVRMPWITRFSQANREVIERLNKLWLRALQFTVDVFDEGFKHEVGDLIAVTWPHSGYAALPCRVLKPSEIKDGWSLRVEIDDPDAFSDVVETGPTGTNSNLPTPLNPPPVTNVVASEELFVDQDGVTRSRLVVEWDEPANYPYVAGYRISVVESYLTQVIDTQVARGSTRFSVVLPAGYGYLVGVQTVSTAGVRAASVADFITLEGKLDDPPSNVTGLAAAPVSDQVVIEWDAPTDSDWTATELRYDVVGGDWSTATLIDRVAAPLTHLSTRALPAGDWTVFAKHLDAVRDATYPFGQESVTAAEVDVTAPGAGGVAVDVAASLLPLQISQLHKFEGDVNAGTIRFMGEVHVEPMTTSATSLTPGTGSKTFTVDSSHFSVLTGDPVSVYSRGAPTATMAGTVVSFIGTALVLNVTSAAGSGAHTDWTLTAGLKQNRVLHLIPSAIITTGDPAALPSFGGIGWNYLFPVMSRYGTSYAGIGAIRFGDIGYSGTSTTIGTGSKTFAVSASLYMTGITTVRLASLANQNNWMQGTVTSYSGTSLVVNVTSVGGSGTFTDWYIGNCDAAGGGKGWYTRAAAAPGFGTGAITGGVLNFFAVVVASVHAVESQKSLTHAWVMEVQGQGPAPDFPGEAHLIRMQGDGVNPWHIGIYGDPTMLLGNSFILRDQPAGAIDNFLCLRNGSGALFTADYRGALTLVNTNVAGGSMASLTVNTASVSGTAATYGIKTTAFGVAGSVAAAFWMGGDGVNPWHHGLIGYSDLVLDGAFLQRNYGAGDTSDLLRSYSSGLALKFQITHDGVLTGGPMTAVAQAATSSNTVGLSLNMGAVSGAAYVGGMDINALGVGPTNNSALIRLLGDSTNAWEHGIVGLGSLPLRSAFLQRNKPSGDTSKLINFIDAGATVLYAVDYRGTVTQANSNVSAGTLAALTLNVASVTGATLTSGIALTLFGVADPNTGTGFSMGGDGTNYWDNGFNVTAKLRAAAYQRILSAGDTSHLLRQFDASLADNYHVDYAGATSQAGNLVLTGAGRRLVADMTATAVADRFSFVTSVPNSTTVLSVVPSGTGVVSRLLLHNNGTPTNCESLQLSAIGTGGAQEIRIASVIQGTGTYRRLTLFNSNKESAAVETDNSITLKCGAANGQSVNVKVLTELLTIAAAASSDTTIQMPANALILAVPVRVTAGVTSTSNFTVGDAGSAARFSTAAVSKAATSTDPGTKAGAYYNATATPVRITPDTTPTDNTGRVRVSIFYLDCTPPTS